MGNVRMCFDTGVYQRALADADASGFDVNGETTNLSGSYYCDNGEWDDTFLIDLGSKVTGYIKDRPIWVDDSGKIFEVIELDDLPQGVVAVVSDRSKPVNSMDDLLYQSLREFYQCEVKGNKKCVEDVEKNVGVERARLEAKKVAAAEAQRRAEEAKKVATEQQRQAEVAGYIRKGNDIWTKAQQLIDLAEKCDDGPGGIDPDDLIAIRNDYLAKKTMPTNLEEAKKYYEQAKDMFVKMVEDDSGLDSIDEKGGEIGCRTIPGLEPSSCGDSSKKPAPGSEGVECGDWIVRTPSVGECVSKCGALHHWSGDRCVQDSNRGRQ